MPLAFVFVKARVGREREAHSSLASLPGVVEVRPLLGEHDMVCKVEAQDYEAMGSFVSERVRTSAGVASTYTLTVRPEGAVA